MGDRVMMCELRDDDQAGAGFDVQLIEAGELEPHACTVRKPCHAARAYS
jgi:hypothetical protein